MVTQVILSGGHLLCLQSGYHTGWTPASITGTVLTLPSPAAQGAREPHFTRHRHRGSSVTAPVLSLTPCPFLATEPVEEDEETPQLLRTKSDAACVIQRRPRSRAPGEAQRTRRHRFSINGHFYNHKVTAQPGLSPGP